MRRWYVAMDASHTMLMAGLRHKIGPDGDVEAAYRQWNKDRRARKIKAYEAAHQRHLKHNSDPASANAPPTTSDHAS